VNREVVYEDIGRICIEIEGDQCGSTASGKAMLNCVVVVGTHPWTRIRILVLHLWYEDGQNSSIICHIAYNTKVFESKT
jgi:hypothetical protein